MTMRWMKQLLHARAAAVATLAVAAALAGCGLDGVTIPGLSGPAELALSVKLTANPDILTADGLSTSSIQVEVRGPDGQPVAGKDIFFAIASGTGIFADIGTLSAERAVTGSNGIAQVIYTAPPRTDFTADDSVLIAARPVGNDANAAIYRQVRVELRSPEPKLFPPNPTNKPPDCSFTIEKPNGEHVGVDILFQDTSSDSDGFIVRYIWDFGDGTQDDKPDVAHRYRLPGTYTVTHKVTDNNGADDRCEVTFTVD